MRPLFRLLAFGVFKGCRMMVYGLARAMGLPIKSTSSRSQLTSVRSLLDCDFFCVRDPFLLLSTAKRFKKLNFS